jgi:hypothetical protein
MGRRETATFLRAKKPNPSRIFFFLLQQNGILRNSLSYCWRRFLFILFTNVPCSQGLHAKAAAMAGAMARRRRERKEKDEERGAEETTCPGWF